jgi:hypothetical protein
MKIQDYCNQKIFIYEQFITYLKKAETFLNRKDKNLEKHHIIPLHDGGKKDGETILCTSKQHTLAHYYRYLTYGQLLPLPLGL